MAASDVRLNAMSSFVSWEAIPLLLSLLVLWQIKRPLHTSCIADDFRAIYYGMFPCKEKIIIGQNEHDCVINQGNLMQRQRLCLAWGKSDLVWLILQKIFFLAAFGRQNRFLFWWDLKCGNEPLEICCGQAYDFLSEFLIRVWITGVICADS